MLMNKISKLCVTRDEAIEYFKNCVYDNVDI